MSTPGVDEDGEALAGLVSPTHAASAWAWGLGAGLGHDIGQSSSQSKSDASVGARYVSPFMSLPPKEGPPRAADVDDDDDAGLSSFRVPPPIDTSHLLLSVSNQSSAQSQHLGVKSMDSSSVSTSASVTPRSARSPIGPSLRSLHDDASSNMHHSFTSGVVLKLEDDAGVVYGGRQRLGGVGNGQPRGGLVSKLGDSGFAPAGSSHLNSPFSATTRTSVSASPLSTPNFASQSHAASHVTSGQHSPRSPDFTTHTNGAAFGPTPTLSRVPSIGSRSGLSRVPSNNHIGQTQQPVGTPPGGSSHPRGSSAELEYGHHAASEEQSLAGVFTSSSQMQQQERYQSATSPQQHYSLLPSMQAQTQESQPRRPSASPPSLPSLVESHSSASQSPSSSAPSSGGGDVAYVVLPNGQVQAIPLATLQPHLNSNASTPSNAAVARPPHIPTHTSPTAQQQFQHTSPTVQHYAHTQPSHHSQSQSQSHSAYPSPTHQYDAPPSDGDCFSLATLSTQTLPLFTPPPAPTTHTSTSMHSPHTSYQHPSHTQHSSVPAHPTHAPRALPPVGLRRDSSPYMSHSEHHPTAPEHHGHNLPQLSHGYSQPPSHSPSPSPTSPRSPHGMAMAGPPGSGQTVTVGGTHMSVEHARELMRQLSLQMAPNTHPQQTLPQQQHHQPPPPSSHHTSLPPHPHSASGSAPVTPFHSYHPSPLGLGLMSEGMVGLAKSQAGSRLIQTKLGQNDPTYYASVFDEVYEALPELMVDLFGNYLCQKLITYANDTQRLQLLLKVLPELLEISCDRQGTRAIQKLIDSLRHQSERQLVLEWLSMPMQPGQGRGGVGRDRASRAEGQVSPHAVHSVPPPSHSPSPPPSSSPALGASSTESSDPSSPSAHGIPSPQSALLVGGVHPSMPRLIHLIRDSNGSHVVHAILDSFPSHMLQPIHCNAVHECKSLGIDQHGLCVLKKCLSMCSLSSFLTFTLRFLLEHALELATNQYGNYLIQHILERTNQTIVAGAAGGSGTANGTGEKGAAQSGSSSQSSPQQRAQAASDQDDPSREKLHLINEMLYSRLRGHFARLSRQKFSSNVVEKCLKSMRHTPALRQAIVAELIEPDSVALLLQCSYGNYVLQNVLYVASQEECALLFARVRPEAVLNSLRKNVRNKWERMLANAHLIHPGLAPGGAPVANATNEKQGGGGAAAPAASAASAATGSSGAASPSDASADKSSAQTSTGSDSPSSDPAQRFPTPSAVQLITSILGTNAPSNAASATTYDASGAPLIDSRSGNASGFSTPQASPAIRGNNSPMLVSGRYLGGSQGTRGGSSTPLYSGKGERRGPMSSSHSTVASAVSSPYHTSSSVGASPSFLPRGHFGGSGNTSAAASPLYSPHTPYQMTPSQHQHASPYSHASPHLSHSGSSPSFGGQHASHPYSSTSTPSDSYHPSHGHSHYRGGSGPSTPAHYSSKLGPQGHRDAHPQPPLHTARQSAPPSQPQVLVAGGAQTIEQQIQAHQAQLQQLLALQAQASQQQQQQHGQQPSSFNVMLLPNPPQPQSQQSRVSLPQVQSSQQPHARNQQPHAQPSYSHSSYSNY